LASPPVLSRTLRYGGKADEARVSARAATLAAAVPLVFLHVNHQPSVSLPVGGTSVDVTLADLAILAVALTAVASGLRRGLRPTSVRYGRYRVLDVGCGVKPYLPFFEPFADAFVGVDVADNPHADVRGRVEDLPVEDGLFEIVLCNQVLEHCDDPTHAVRELRRVVAPGECVLASTHGVQVYHPAPEDLWRWTHAGRDRLFSQNGDWASLSVRPGSGTTACLGMLLAHYVDLVAQKARARVLGKPLVAALNLGARGLDRRVPSLRELIPGSLIATCHVVAEAPR